MRTESVRVVWALCALTTRRDRGCAALAAQPRKDTRAYGHTEQRTRSYLL